MEVRRTVRVTLDMDSADDALLHDTVDEFLWAAQYVVDYAFQGEYVTTSKGQLQDETYDTVCEQTPLNTGLVQNARNKAAEACKSVVEKWNQGKKASTPRMTSPHVVYDHRTATFYDDSASLATTDGRVEVDYVLPSKDSDTPHAAFLFSDAYETTGAELHRKHGEWHLHIHCKRAMESDTPEQATPENGTVLGVDLGVNN
ncbi:MAG: RNA-guided endonuclease TnpB family protein, partial [Natronomonas sp.]